MRVLKLAATLAFAVAGCAPRYSWYYPGVDPTVAERQREIDSAECTAVAMRSIPLPNLPTPPAAAATSAPSHYSVSGTTTVYGANGESYTGYYSDTANGAAPYESPAQAQMEGAEASQAMIDSYRRNQAYRAQDQLADACMMRRGWTKVMAGRQPNPAATPAAVTQAPQATVTPPIQPAAPIAKDPSPSGAPFQSFGDWQKSNGN